MKYEFNNMYLSELQELFLELGEKKYRAEQLFRHIHQRKNYNLDECNQLPKSLKEKLSEIGKINSPRIYNKLESKVDNTKKYLIQLEDNGLIETVFMDYGTYHTVCVSSQVGCRMGCTFCASTKASFRRNLTASEILSQIYLIEKDLDINITNIVLMGIGEPLDNYNNVVKFMRLINDDKGRNLSLRNITISTCGIATKIYKLADEKMPVTLTISLHNPFEVERRKIMPISNNFPIEEILKSCDYYFEKTSRRVSFEYTIIKGINDSKEHAMELIKLLKGKNCHINIIPLNPIKEFNGIAPDTKFIYKFQNILENSGIPATIRKKQGDDINGACGQLRRGELEKDNG